MPSAEELTRKKCVPCEGGAEPLSAGEVAGYLSTLPEWGLVEGQQMIRRKWKFKDFVAALAFVNKIGDVAEAEQHHPDLHLTGWNRVSVEITTHAIGGLSENDFILAAKIDQLT